MVSGLYVKDGRSIKYQSKKQYCGIDGATPELIDISRNNARKVLVTRLEDGTLLLS